MNIPQNVNEALLIISAVVSALVVPAITNFLTARNADGSTKQAVAAVLALVVALAAVALSQSFDLTNLSGTILTVLIAAKAGYEVFSHVIDPLHDSGPQLGAKNAGS